MARELTVRLLGSFSLALGELELTGVHTTRLQALLAYLLLHRDAPQSRQQLAFLFWPDTNEAQAHTNLRQLLHTLRRRLSESDTYLEVTERTVCWRRDAPYTLDVAEFEAAFAEASRAEGSDRLAALERSVAAYGGELLPGCYDDWVLPERERLAQRYLDALEQLILLLEQRRDYGRAIHHAQRLLGDDPLHEAVYRHLMRLHAVNGDRAAALHVYHTCVSVLERELGVPPGAATVDAYQHLLDLERGPAPAPILSSPARMVGRQAEWRALQDLWRAVKSGGIYCACLAGEAGIGKTRLAEEMLHWARQQGVSAAVTRAYAGGASLAYAPLVELLRSAALRPHVAQLPAIWRAELARLLPELLVEDPRLPRPDPLTEPSQVQRIWDAIGHVLLRPKQPLILLLDDLQWFDTETLAWLRYLLRPNAQTGTEAGHGPRLLMLATLRSDELDQGHPLARLLLELRCSDHLVELVLAPLSAGETAELAAGIAERRLDAATAAAVHRDTEGNPLFVVETVRAGLASASSAGFVPAPQVAPKVQAVIRLRLAQLSPSARELAELAAAIGRSFAYDVLALAAEQDEGTVGRSLDELWRRRIIREQGASAYDFVHDRLRDVAYGDISLARRRLMHRRLARALETIHSQDTAPVSAQLAHHYEQAGQFEPAIHYLHSAADHAYQVYAYNESIGLLNQGLNLLQSLPASTVRMELELELQMALCMAWAAATSYFGVEVEAAYHRALALCRAIGNLPHLFTALWGIHEVALYRGEYRESLESAQRCLEVAEDLDDPGLWLEAHHAVWGPCHFLGQYEQALAHIERGLAHYDHASHEMLSALYGVHDAKDCALHFSALACWDMGFIDQASRKLDAAIEHGRGLTLPANIADSCAYSGLVLHLLRDPRRVRPFAETALNIGSEKGYPNARFLGATMLAWSLAAQGHAAEGVAMAEQAMAARGNFGQRAGRSQFTAILAETYILAGRYSEAVGIADAGILEFGRFRDLICAPDLWTLRGNALQALCAPDDQIEGCYQAALTLARELGARVSELRAAVSLARMQKCQGRQAEGHNILHEVYSWFSEGFQGVDLQIAAQLLHELAFSR